MRIDRCPDAGRLAGWLEDTLAARERKEIAAHLAECDDCRRTVALSAEASETPAAPLEEGAVARWMRRVRPAGPPVWSWVAAAAVLVAVAFLALPRLRPAPLEPTCAWPVLGTGEMARDADPPKDEPKKEEKREIARKTKAPPGVEPENLPPRREDPPKRETPKDETAKNETRTDQSALYEPLALLDASGDLWRGSDRVEGGARAGYGTVLESRSASAGFTLDGRATVAIEPKTRLWVARAKQDRAFTIALEAGFAFVDTEGAAQTWKLVGGVASLFLPRVRGRLLLELADGRLRVHVLQGEADTPEKRTVEAGHTLTAGESGAVVTPGSATADRKRLDRLREIRPASRTAFRATFDDDAFGFTVRGTVRKGENGNCLGSDSGGVALRLENPVPYQTGMILRFRCRSDADLTIRSGKYGTVAGGGDGWRTVEIPVEQFEDEAVPIVSGDLLEELRFLPVRDCGVEVDGVELIVRGR